MQFQNLQYYMNLGCKFGNKKEQSYLFPYFFQKYFGDPPRIYLEFYTGDCFSRVPSLSQFFKHILVHVYNVTSVHPF